MIFRFHFGYEFNLLNITTDLKKKNDATIKLLYKTLYVRFEFSRIAKYHHALIQSTQARRNAKEHLIHGGANNSRRRNMIEADASAGDYMHTLACISLSQSLYVCPHELVSVMLSRKRESITEPRRW